MRVVSEEGGNLLYYFIGDKGLVSIQYVIMIQKWILRDRDFISVNWEVRVNIFNVFLNLQGEIREIGYFQICEVIF